MVVFPFLICARKVGGGHGPTRPHPPPPPTPTALHKGSVVVEKIKEVELRSRTVQFVHDRNYTRIGLQPRANTASRHRSGEEVKTSVTQKEKSKGISMEGIRKRSFPILPPHSQLLPQPLILLLNARGKGGIHSNVTTWLNGACPIYCAKTKL